MRSLNPFVQLVMGEQSKCTDVRREAGANPFFGDQKFVFGYDHYNCVDVFVWDKKEVGRSCKVKNTDDAYLVGQGKIAIRSQDRREESNEKPKTHLVSIFRDYGKTTKREVGFVEVDIIFTNFINPNQKSTDENEDNTTTNDHASASAGKMHASASGSFGRSGSRLSSSVGIGVDVKKNLEASPESSNKRDSMQFSGFSLDLTNVEGTRDPDRGRRGSKHSKSRGSESIRGSTVAKESKFFGKSSRQDTFMSANSLGLNSASLAMHDEASANGSLAGSQG